MGDEQTTEEKILYNSLALGHREIRLLNVVTQPDIQVIKCTMRTVSLDNLEPFAALSYSWGDNTRRHSMLVNTLPVRLTDSLHAALKNMASVASPLNIWADAICINQWDKGERGEQVQLMGDIYESAAAVLVWLGPEDEESNKAIQLIDEWGSRYHPDEGMDVALSTMHEPFDPESWAALGSLLARTWWGRLWTVQEVVMNKNVELFVGKSSFEFKNFIRAFLAWDSLDYIEGAGLGGRDQAEMISSVLSTTGVVPVKVTLWIERHLMGKNRSDMVELVRYCTAFDVADPRDRIFGLLGMTGPVAKFHPDYSKTTAEIYADFTKAMVESGQTDVLRNARYTGSSNPSWVPDWQLGDQSFFHVDLNNASLNTTPTCEFSQDLKRLQMAATVYDLVTECGPAEDLASILATASKIWGRVYCNKMSVFEAVFRWTQADESRSKRLPSDLVGREDIIKDFASDVTQLCPDQAIRNLGLLSADRKTLLIEIIRSIDTSTKTGRSISTNDFNNDTTFSAYYRQKEMVSAARHFFMTNKGLLGRAVAKVEPGDVIAIVLGLRVPLILRKYEEHYVIIGECFVLGLMDGEAMQELESQKSPAEKIEVW
jgi:hypothetical protein